MGQRFQSVFILPSIYMNEDNPNNRNEKAFIFHNQWLYGFEACEVNLIIMNRLKKAISKRKDCGHFAKTKEEFINHFLEGSLNNAIKWAGLQDLHNERTFHESGAFEMGKEVKLSNELIRQDNNNGFFICIIDKELNLKYGFISGLEDTEIYSLKTPEEYFKLFYTEKQFKELSKHDKKVFEDLKKFKAITTLKPIIEEMNEHLLMVENSRN